MLMESVNNAQALFAFFALSPASTSSSRATCSTSTTPGSTPAGLIMTKVMLFLPQFVVVVAFPDMATGRERRQRALVRSLVAIGATRRARRGSQPSCCRAWR